MGAASDLSEPQVFEMIIHQRFTFRHILFLKIALHSSFDVQCEWSKWKQSPFPTSTKICHFHHFQLPLLHPWFKLCPFRKILVKCQTRPEVLIILQYIFVSQKVSLLKISDDVISFVVWATQSKILATPMFKTLHFGLHFESNLAKGKGTLLTAIFLVANHKSLEELT